VKKLFLYTAVTTCPFFSLHLPLKQAVMSVARDTLRNLLIQAVVTQKRRERSGRDKDSRHSNVGANLYRLL